MKQFGFQWHITDRCNMRCTHCYQDGFGTTRELPIAQLYRMADIIFNELRDRQITVNLTGGEPLLYPHILDLLRHLHRYPNLEEVDLITNGTIAEPGLVSKLQEFHKLAYLKVSLESGVERINDRIRGQGNLDRVVTNIHKLADLSKKPIILMTTLARYNLETIEETVSLARRLPVAGIIFERFVPLGNGGQLAGEVLTGRGWRQATETLLTLSGLEANPIDLATIRAYWLWTESGHFEPLTGAYCNLGDESMALMPTGDIYPCRRYSKKIGNILSDSFPNILETLASYSPLETKRQLTGPLCPACDEYDCVGCRALTLALTGDPTADDSQCLRHS